MVTKDPDGNILQFNRQWQPIRAGQWLQDMLPKPSVLDYMQCKYGDSGLPHWVLVGKEKQRVFVMKSRAGGGEDFDDAKTNGTNRNHKEFAIRIGVY